MLILVNESLGETGSGTGSANLYYSMHFCEKTRIFAKISGLLSMHFCPKRAFLPMLVGYSPCTFIKKTRIFAHVGLL